MNSIFSKLSEVYYLADYYSKFDLVRLRQSFGFHKLIRIICINLYKLVL